MRLLIAAVTLFSAHSAFASCAMTEYIFEGTVEDAASRRAIVGANVFVFLEKEPVVWARGFQTVAPESATTDELGAFSATSWMDSFKSWNFFFGHNCSRTPKRADIVVIAPGYLARRLVVEELQLTRKNNTHKLRPILLSRSVRGMP